MRYDNLSDVAKATYDAHRAFYTHPVIAELADRPLWTYSDSEKMPVSVYSRTEYNRTKRPYVGKDGVARTYYGASSKRPRDMTTLTRVLNLFPKVQNHAYLLNNDQMHAVLDIEKTCPDAIKKDLLALPWTYGETSLSGRGLHLFLPWPELLLAAFPDAERPVLKEEHGYFELHLSHWITFTRNMIEPNDSYGTLEMNDVLLDLFKAQKPRVTMQTVSATVTNPETDIRDYDVIFDDVKRIMSTYSKTQADFGGDTSRYDFSIATTIARRLYALSLKEKRYKFCDYSVREMATIVANGMRWYFDEIKFDRPKYHETRDGLPFLVWRACAALSALIEDKDLVMHDA